MTNYRKTFVGMVGRMYYYILRRTSTYMDEAHESYLNLRVMSREQFYGMALNSIQLKSLYKTWKRNNYLLTLRPVPDRINSKKGYIKNNIRFMTYTDNARLAGNKKSKWRKRKQF